MFDPVELQNLKNCCLRVIKIPDVNEESMKYLMALVNKISDMQKKPVVDNSKV